ncbi:hypothetical protein OB955_11840 [Halobacteria archaeon AArc-m2/3/4]|uniref:Uncharacterized protein n=1 Tax=Natronoglomus mannanivorans TaxID=2979990 RepID=A0AAP2Z1R4_9EURY|nr:hypothetical protein [Halobacteria archaeon AArc-xg1-1]MCU4973432.1 hypothetical protein [Halobacteria archaeon AArc-m2/3/4]
MNEKGRAGDSTEAELALLISALSLGVVLFLVFPDATPMASVPTANLYLALPFVLVGIFCFQLGLEGMMDDD